MARMPIFGHMFCGHNSTISGSIGLKFCMGVQQTIIYRLVMRNLSYDAYFSVLIFWATFGRKMGVATTCTPNPNQKDGQLGGPFGPTTVSKSCFRNFQGCTPPSLINSQTNYNSFLLLAWPFDILKMEGGKVVTGVCLT